MDSQSVTVSFSQDGPSLEEVIRQILMNQEGEGSGEPYSAVSPAFERR
ncbi:MAG: hypothetical protein ACI4QW_06235 [Clostridia bacterium]